MSWFVVGDVHGCAEELRAILRHASGRQVLLLGDLFTKGPDPVGVWECVRECGADAILGNHDLRLLDIVDGNRPGDLHGLSVVEDLNRADPTWAAWLQSRPLWKDIGWGLAVHAGLPPDGEVLGVAPDVLTCVRVLKTGPAKGQHWVDAYEGPRRVVYGHDARRGIRRSVRDGHLRTLGLDSGCVYGGQLTAWMPDLDRMVQIPARRVYRSV